MKSSYLWAGLISVLIAGWFVSGNMEKLGLKAPQAPVKKVADSKPKAAKLFQVEVKTFTAAARPTSLVVRGRTQAEKHVSALARTSGIVEQSDISEGDVVKAGDLLCRLDMNDRKARLVQAKAQLISSRRDYEAATKLVKRKFVSEAKMASERARYDAALAAVEQIKQDISYTRITAPISGIVTSFKGEKGEFLQPGKPCAVISSFDPILIVAQVGERDVISVKPGHTAYARLVTGEKLEGKVTFIAPIADAATRTFKVEISVDNKAGKVRDGITAEITFPLQPVRAHLLPAGVITLADNGEIGVRTIVDGDKVKFMPVKLVAQTRKGTWVKGLPDVVKVIITGQDYVLDGEKVIAVETGPAS